ncbi:MAG: kelch repeat-containing protein [Pseudomonadota bacterium]
MPLFPRPSVLRCLALPAIAAGALLLAACDGEKVEYDSDRYEIEWTRINGGAGPVTGLTAAGTYGTLGVADPANRPGARNGAVSWTDKDGTFWLFGGIGYDVTGTSGRLNDLWKLEAGGWKWVAGANTAEGAATYGTQGAASALNTPGGRSQAVGWADDDGVLWLFGGNGLDAADNLGRLGDLWKFDPAAGQWTWVDGSDLVEQPGVYGTKGTADPANQPGARHAAAGWIDTAGLLWLFGGQGRAAGSSCCWLNDLWKYDPATGQWTWVKGSDTANAAAVYATAAAVADDPATTTVDESRPEIVAADLTPGGRYGIAAWHTPDPLPDDGTPSEYAWVFGGTGNDAGGDRVVFNELWRFNGTDWLFAHGAQGKFSGGHYGGRGFFSFNNDPPGRHRPVAWQTGSTLWLYGGAVDALDDEQDLPVYPNDLWRWDSIGWTWVGGSNDIEADAAGKYPADLGGRGLPAGREGGVGWTDSTGGLWLFSGVAEGDLTGSSVFDDIWLQQP